MAKIEFPITVNGVDFPKQNAVEDSWRCKCGDFVSVRPCGEEYGEKTYLGVFLGDIAQTSMVSFNRESGRLQFSLAMHNPAMFVPDLGKIIYGCGSWWGKIKDEESLRTITDLDIDNVWYVKALKHLSEDPAENTQ